MPWHSYVACFFAGAFLAGAVPHFVKGITGEPFPTPFAKPPGKGLSSPAVNILWSLLNLIIGVALFRASHLPHRQHLAHAVFFAGMTLISVQLSGWFSANSNPR